MTTKRSPEATDNQLAKENRQILGRLLKHDLAGVGALKGDKPNRTSSLEVDLSLDTDSVEREAVRELVEQRLRADPELRGSEFKVELKDGRISLQGKVHAEWAKMIAREIAQAVAGEEAVDDELRVVEPLVERNAVEVRGSAYK